MNKVLSVFVLSAFLIISVPSVFAWQYDGLGSLNPFTGFRTCNKCVKPKKDKCCQKVKVCPVIQEPPCPCTIK